MFRGNEEDSLNNVVDTHTATQKPAVKGLSKQMDTHIHTEFAKMSLFRKPKKNVQRRAFSEFEDEQDPPTDKDNDGGEKESQAPRNKAKETKPEKPKKERPSTTTTTLLSFGDEEGMEQLTYGVSQPLPLINIHLQRKRRCSR